MSIKNRTFTDEEFIIAVKNNFSKAGVIKSLSLIPAGANYKMFNEVTKRLKLDTSHFTGRAHLKGKTHNWAKSIDLSKILVIGSTYSSHKLNKRLIKDKIFEDKCFRCGITTWQGEKLSLHLDHINGINNDNRIENLRLLCPNCHSLTPTYCGKNKKTSEKSNVCMDCGNKISKNAKRCASCFGKISKNKTVAHKKCLDCNKKISAKSIRCKSCSNKVKKQYKIFWPEPQILLNMLKTSSYLSVGKKLGVSDNAVRKHIKNNPIKEIILSVK